ncbi:MAG: GNAT family N-acetyltransferase [Sandaracinaceae bacterium]|nr:GNAT family N-acetyltransferase [Sandaracinaceae bacterium]
MEELEPGALATDAILVRTLATQDLDAIVRIDRESMGRSRREYYEAKVRRALDDARLATSLVALIDGHVVGFVLTQLNYGEFGRVEPSAVIDSIGVDPRFRGRNVGEAMMRQLEMNLRALHVEHLETQVSWSQRELLSFLADRGFGPAPVIHLRLDLP